MTGKIDPSQMQHFGAHEENKEPKSEWVLNSLKRPPRSPDLPPIRAAYGALRFPHQRSTVPTPGSAERTREPSKWISVSVSSKPADVASFLQNVWGLRSPTVIIDITGAAGPIGGLSEDARKVVEIGLLHAVRATKGWVCT